MNGPVTQLILSARNGNRRALDALMPLIHDELQATAHRQLRGERIGHTLDTSALVNETYLRLAEQDRAQWQNRSHFLAVAAIVMRRVLVNYAKQHNRAKRGGGAVQLTLGQAQHVASETPDVDVEALDEALTRLAAIDNRAARVVECRYFGGLDIDETAEALNIAPATVKRDWLLAKTWLRRELESDGA
ncbi:sigma-70 family RNA polymerase sigma factor [Sinimarinibacterium flocculans]|uniref:RNA polymerase ECF family sigma subunit n=1 Tax=Sinimarinibacterium flocculans TaxID=985250 RepID=A0A318ECI1_9GAMM|nr:sigma-70 family RNA polymerase sigma factor [Sinimarinibacterium flocculans]PXV70191.1 RNA polymerase ECF family sigma subunit [Sinimarinibacterium flocculans]